MWGDEKNQERTAQIRSEVEEVAKVAKADGRLDERLRLEVDFLCEAYDIEYYADILDRARRYEHSTGWQVRPRLAAMMAVDAYLSERGL